MHQLAYVLHSYWPQAYRLLRCVLALPREDWLRVRFGEDVERIEVVLEDVGALPAFLADYRTRNGIVAGAVPKVVLGMDATSLSRTGVRLVPGSVGGVMAYLMMPLDRRFPDVLIHLECSVGLRPFGFDEDRR
jgi:hypothetical protein